MVHLTQVLVATAALSTAALAAMISPLERRAGCNADNCLRQLRGGPSSVAASAYCSSVLSVPVVTATAAAPFVVTVTSTITTSSTLNVQLPTYPGYNAKRDADPAPEATGFERRLVTETAATPTTPPPTVRTVPAFASMCTSTGTAAPRLQSACSCLSISTSTTTVTPTTTTTVGPTITATVCPTNGPLTPLNGYSMRGNNRQGGFRLELASTALDAAQCCGACYSRNDCATYEWIGYSKECVLEFQYGPAIGTGQCPAGLGSVFDVSYSANGYSGLGPCAKFQ